MPEARAGSRLSLRRDPGPSLLADAAQETRVHPEMYLKTNESVRSGKTKGFRDWYADPGSRHLAPDSCSSRNAGATGDVYENKGVAEIIPATFAIPPPTRGVSKLECEL